MKTTGSRQKPRYELYGCVAISPGLPSFGLPVFRSTSGIGFGQVVDEITGRIREFRGVDLGETKVVPVAGVTQFRVGDAPGLCLLQSEFVALGGSVKSLHQHLENVIADETSSLSVKLQAAALIDPSEERRLRRSINSTASEQPALRAYNRSLGRIILWDKLIRSAKSAEVAERTLILRPQIDLDFTPDGSVKLHLAVISSSDYPTLNFETLATAIEVELGLTVPSNDEVGDLDKPEAIFTITPEDLRSYLDRLIGSDARISGHTYRWTTSLLKDLGFRNMQQVDEALTGYSGRHVSYVATGNLQGQTTKLELMLLAAMGERFIQRHPWRGSPWFLAGETRKLEEFAKAGISTKDYDPLLT